MHEISLFHLFIFDIQSILESHDHTCHTHLRPCPSKIFLTCFYFLKICINIKKISFSICSFLTYSQLSPVTIWPHPFLAMSTSKTFKHLLICKNFYQHPKNQLIPSVHSSDTVNFRVHTWLTTPIFDHNQPKNFQSAFNFCEFVSTCKKWSCFIYWFWRKIADLKILQSGWVSAFWPTSQE